MKYNFRVLELKSGRKRLVMDIEGDENIALSSMINTEMPNFSDDIMETVETALSGKEAGFGGNLYNIICKNDFTVVENQVADEEVSRVPTATLKTLLDEWNDNVTKAKSGNFDEVSMTVQNIASPGEILTGDSGAYYMNKMKNELEVTKMIKDDCIFCKLANGVFPTYTVYEDDDFRVILDASPAVKGHSLIIPKQHADNLYEVDDETAAKLMPLAKKVANSMKKTFNCDGVNVLQNNEPAAGQTVFHLHVHVIPRYKEDGVGLTWKQLTTDPDEQTEIAEKLAGNM